MILIDLCMGENLFLFDMNINKMYPQIQTLPLRLDFFSSGRRA